VTWSQHTSCPRPAGQATARTVSVPQEVPTTALAQQANNPCHMLLHGVKHLGSSKSSWGTSCDIQFQSLFITDNVPQSVMQVALTFEIFMRSSSLRHSRCLCMSRLISRRVLGCRQGCRAGQECQLQTYTDVYPCTAVPKTADEIHPGVASLSYHRTCHISCMTVTPLRCTPRGSMCGQSHTPCGSPQTAAARQCMHRQCLRQCIHACTMPREV
jgi:hypothetical protein